MLSVGAVVAVRFDAGPDVGLGHFRRCLTLVRQLDMDGFNVRLIGTRRISSTCSRHTGAIPLSWLEDESKVWGGRLDGEEEDARATLAIVGSDPVGPSLVIVDSYKLSEKWETVVRRAGHRVLAIDDFRDRRHCADILVSDTAKPFDRHLNSCPGSVTVLTGREYALIDQDFSPHLASGARYDARLRLLISYGGADPTGETLKALAALRLIQRESRARYCLDAIDVVVGPANPNERGIRASAEGVSGALIHSAPSGLAPLMRNAGLFLTAAGNSMVEALAMGLPCVVTLTGENQAAMADELLAEGLIRVVGEHGSVGPEDVCAALAQVLSEYDEYASHVQSHRVFDHLGAMRISSAIRSEVCGQLPVQPQCN